jgi:hypothetical protein
MTTLPEVRAQMSRASRMGTPDWRSVPSVRVKLATAILRNVGPMTGSVIWSRWMKNFPARVR